MRNPGPTVLSNDHSQKAKMVAARLRNFIDAIEGRSNLKIGPHSTAALMETAADLFERMCGDKSRGKRSTADIVFMKKHPGQYFIRQGSILVRRAFHSPIAAKQWAKENYRSDTGWTLLS